MRPTEFAGLPDRIARLPLDERGFPIPWFVAWFGGKPDFRVIHTPRYRQAWDGQLCWVCGQKLGSFRAWVMGPVSLIEGATPEPPAHLDCGQFAARRCPYLANPRMRRNGRALPAHGQAAGVTLEVEGGLTAIWITKGRGARPVEASGGAMFELDPPVRVEWYREGRVASPDEARAGLALGVPLLRAAVARQGPAALADLERRILKVERWLPPHAVPASG